MIIICGGGIIGLSIAKELIKRGAEDILVLEKERNLGVHASGRNSGVLHAGIYYTPDSFKAKFCLKGNLMMKEYCREKGLPVIECGKVIVAKNEKEAGVIEELYRRAKANGSTVKIIDQQELKEIEPYAKTVEKALYSPLTAVVDPIKVLNSLEKDLRASGKVKFLKGTKLTGFKGSCILKTTGGEYKFSLFINSAGAHSDRIAHWFGLGLNYTVLPFKGTYKKLRKDKSYLVKGNIYPVPDLGNPFLGVHLTKSHTGEVYIGPTAIPALGRENYGFISGSDMEAFSILLKCALLFIKNDKFRKVALSEPRKYIKRFFYNDVKSMVRDLNYSDIIPSSKVGIRPQVVDWERKELVMDFLVLKDSDSVHILNAISPAFTSAFPFAEFVVSKYVFQEN